MRVVVGDDGFRTTSMRYEVTGEELVLKEIDGLLLRQVQALPEVDLGQALVGLHVMHNGARLFATPLDAVEGVSSWPVGKIRAIEAAAEILNDDAEDPSPEP